MTSKRWMASLMAILVAAVAACSGGGASSAPASGAASVAPSAAASAEASSAGPVTIEWWHITNTDPGKADFQAIADAYTAAHPNVKINITVLENEAFKTKLQATAQSGDIPDLFQSWGGGTMREQADAGLLKDITADIASWKDTINPGALGIYAYNGKQYAVPWDLGIFGVWNNTEQFTTAGITTPPATWDDFLSAVDKLEAAKIAPISMGLKDKWPAMHLWALVLLRIAGGDAMTQMVQGGDWNTEACKAAGARDRQAGGQEALPGRLSQRDATTSSRPPSATARRRWRSRVTGALRPRQRKARAARVLATSSAGSRSRPWPEERAYRPMPSAARTESPWARMPHQRRSTSSSSSRRPRTLRRSGRAGTASRRRLGSEASITDPYLKKVVEARNKATFVQLYLDQATSPALGAAINDATAALVAGTSTAEQTCKAITDAAAAQ